MQKIVEILAVGLCVFDIRMVEDGFTADQPCQEICSYCSQQAAYLAGLLRDHDHEQQPAEGDRREDRGS